MNVLGISRIYFLLREVGAVKSKRDFSRCYLSKGCSYLRNVEQRGQLTVPEPVIERLRSRLSEIARFAPRGVAMDLQRIVEALDQDTCIARTLGWM